MNIDIQNFGDYRLTSNGGRSFQLFNRQADRVFMINRYAYNHIMNSKTPEDACRTIERELSWGLK